MEGEGGGGERGGGGTRGGGGGGRGRGRGEGEGERGGGKEGERRGEGADAELAPETRLALYEEAGHLLVADVPTIFLYHRTIPAGSSRL